MKFQISMSDDCVIAISVVLVVFMALLALRGCL